jgi:hypothetical protein
MISIGFGFNGEKKMDDGDECMAEGYSNARFIPPNLLEHALQKEHSRNTSCMGLLWVSTLPCRRRRCCLASPLSPEVREPHILAAR